MWKKKSGLSFLSHPLDNHTNNSPTLKQTPVSTESKDPAALGLYEMSFPLLHLSDIFPLH